LFSFLFQCSIVWQRPRKRFPNSFEAKIDKNDAANAMSAIRFRDKKNAISAIRFREKALITKFVRREKMCLSEKGPKTTPTLSQQQTRKRNT